MSMIWRGEKRERKELKIQSCVGKDMSMRMRSSRNRNESQENQDVERPVQSLGKALFSSLFMTNLFKMSVVNVRWVHRSA